MIEVNTLAKTDTPALEHQSRCTGERTETYEAIAPGGAILRVTRCFDCSAHQAVPIGQTTDAPDAMGAPSLAGHASEPVGPEDALGPGPKRGDYRGRIGDTPSHEVVAVRDPETGETSVRMNEQWPRAADIGEAAGKKGGVTTVEEER